MIAGLPGTGIAGLFYFLSIFFIVTYELFLLLQGRSSKKRWGKILPPFMMALIMLLAAWASSEMLVFTVAYVKTHVYHVAQRPLPPPINPLLVPVFLLFFVTLVVQTLKTAMLLGRKKRRRQVSLEARQKEEVVCSRREPFSGEV